MEAREPDFSGWATKNDIRCADGRTIKSGAFQHMDKVTVPLVWSHQHTDPTNVLGHATLEDRAFGTYTHGYFNDSPKGQHMKHAVKNKDVTTMSIYANNLSERVTRDGKEVYHGDIKEVSLVLAGANPGALIENIYLAHAGTGQVDTIEGEAIIHTGLSLEFDELSEQEKNVSTDDKSLSHAAAAVDADEETLQEIFDGFEDKEKELVYYLLEQATEGSSDDKPAGDLKHSMILDEGSKTEFLAHVDSKLDSKFNTLKEGLTEMTRNLFDTHGAAAGVAARPSLSHDLFETIMKDMRSNGSLRDAFFAHADTGEYGITDIDFLFPDAQTLSNSPELLARRTEWVADVHNSTKHAPFSRIKTIVADITADEARAKGYAKATMKKDEILKLLKRVTTPTTIYKKQKLDRDDVLDITDIDIVAWLKAEMRLMLDEEIARAILVGDGREVDSEDKINEDHIRPIAFDSDLYSEKVNLPTGATTEQTEDAIIRSRAKLKGTGTPTMYTTDEHLTTLFMQRDANGRRIYKTVDELAAALRVTKIVPVEVMEDTPEIIAIIVNLIDYTIGADKGGKISMFDDFDIDWNQQKYLIETRISGALTKPKSAIVIRKSPGNVVIPTQPNYNPTTHVITIPAVTGVIYSIGGADVSAGALPAITETTEVEARAAAGYSFPHGTDSDWVFVF